jgi:hypothetical protein
MKLVLDTFCEVYDLLKPWADGEFWRFVDHDLVEGATYLIGREQFGQNTARIRDIVENNRARIILSNPTEGSHTLRDHCQHFGILDLVLEGKILLLGGGDMPPEFPCLQYDVFMPKILNYDENQQAMSRSKEIYSKLEKPYKFLFLNGRHRPHRKYLIKQWQQQGLLEQSLWTNLDNPQVSSSGIQLFVPENVDLMLEPLDIKYLDPYYEVDYYQHRVNLETTAKYVKHSLFNNTWGEIYLKAEPYIDTYFSVVTETVFDYPWSFRTEKIWKPVAMGHPFVVASNAGYYKDFRRLGFRTFNHLIDESFDNIDNNQDRIQRVAQVVQDLCDQNLADFVAEARGVCKYNQQHLAELAPRIRQEFPQRFFNFLSAYS